MGCSTCGIESIEKNTPDRSSCCSVSYLRKGAMNSMNEHTAASNESTQTLTGKVAIVTGGAGGIGRASALALAAKGADVVIADVSVDSGQAVAEEVKQLGRRSFFYKTDVTQPDQLRALTQWCVEKFGQLDIMFNNAGIGEGGKLLDWGPEQYRRVIAVNQDGVFFGIQAAARVMVELGKGGVIINTGSIYGQLASYYCIGYQAAKAAVEVMTKVAALELAPHAIRVVNVAPGVTDTRMIDGYRKSGRVDEMAKKHMRGALVQPQDVARVVAFLASDEAACINGTTVYADDGFSAFK